MIQHAQQVEPPSGHAVPRPPFRLPGVRGALGKLAWPAAALGLLLLFDFFFVPGFFGVTVQDGRLYGSLIDVLNRAAPVAIVSLGMTLVIATGGVDLSVGAVMAITGALAALLIAERGATVQVAVAVPLAAAVACGMWNGLLVAVFKVQPIVATLLLMVAGRGIAQLVADGQIITFQHAEFAFIGTGYYRMLPFTVYIVAGTLLVLVALTRFTAAGLFIESIGDNETASRFAGVNVWLLKFLVYALSGLCAGIAGLIVTADIRAADANNAGLYLELDAILAAVLGGTALTGGRFSLVGALLGALFIQTLTTTILAKNIPVEWTLVVKATVVLTVCILQAEPIRRMLSSARARRRARRATGYQPVS